LRTVFLGTSEFAATVLERLAAGDHRPALVLSRPDRPRGRGRRVAAPPVAERALALGLALAQPESVNEPPARALIAETQPQAVVVCAFGALIKEPLLSEHELLNVHPSLLPRWRGAAPIERAIIAGDERTGVSIMRLTAGLDSGQVCLTAGEPITPEDTYGSLATRLAKIGGELLVRTLDLTAAGAPPAFAEQDETGVTYAEKIGPEDRLLDPARPASELERVVRALHPHIGARVALADGTLLGVHRARIAEISPSGDDPADGVIADRHQAEAGLTAETGLTAEIGLTAEVGLTAQSGRLLLDCRTGVLELLEVQPPGGRAMDASAYLRGRGLPVRR
jgi:methionyl-tRNA formyltransferase